MKTKLFLLMLISFVVTGAKAQDNQEIVDYYNLKIDELVGKWQDLSVENDEEKTNPVYAKVTDLLPEKYRVIAGIESAPILLFLVLSILGQMML